MLEGGLVGCALLVADAEAEELVVEVGVAAGERDALAEEVPEGVALGLGITNPLVTLRN